MNKKKHEILCNMYPIYSGYSTQEAIRAWESGIEEQLDLEWYINGNLYRTSGKPSRVAVWEASGRKSKSSGLRFKT